MECLEQELGMGLWNYQALTIFYETVTDSLIRPMKGLANGVHTLFVSANGAKNRWGLAQRLGYQIVFSE